MIKLKKYIFRNSETRQAVWSKNYSDFFVAAFDCKKCEVPIQKLNAIEIITMKRQLVKPPRTRPKPVPKPAIIVEAETMNYESK